MFLCEIRFQDEWIEVKSLSGEVHSEISASMKYYC